MSSPSLPKVLFIEDEPRIVAYVALQLGEKVTLLSAARLTEAQTLIKEHPDLALIVWDGQLPDGNSYKEAIQQARKVFPNIPMLAASSSDDFRQLQLYAGCTHDVADNNCHKQVKIGLPDRILDILGIKEPPHA